jgi:protein SCO1
MSAQPISVFTGLVLLSAALLLAGCGRQNGGEAEVGHPLTGQIISVDLERGTALVRHDEIPGYMPAMTMEFRMAPGDLENAREGQRIRARLIEQDGEFWLVRIWPDDQASTSRLDAAGKRLREETVIRGRSVFRDVGETMPEFALLDQSGAVADVTRFRGKQVLLNFIFTRCPDPNMCPAAMARMATVQREAKEAGISNFELVSFTLDPEYDTPGVLRDYARLWGVDLENYSFLTGPSQAVRDLMSQLGVLAFRSDEELWKHTLATILLDEQGRIIHRADGSQWNPQDFVARLRRSP